MGGRDELITESVLVAKVARLTNDGSTVGPGAYDLDKAFRANAASPKGGDNWSVNKTRRQEHFVSKRTEQGVGPGAYQLGKFIDRSIKNPTIPRSEKVMTFEA